MTLSLKREVSNHTSDKGFGNTTSQVCLIKNHSARLSWEQKSLECGEAKVDGSEQDQTKHDTDDTRAS